MTLLPKYEAAQSLAQSCWCHVLVEIICFKASHFRGQTAKLQTLRAVELWRTLAWVLAGNGTWWPHLPWKVLARIDTLPLSFSVWMRQFHWKLCLLAGSQSTGRPQLALRLQRLSLNILRRGDVFAAFSAQAALFGRTCQTISKLQDHVSPSIYVAFKCTESYSKFVDKSFG